jgi:hypothetical protein
MLKITNMAILIEFGVKSGKFKAVGVRTFGNYAQEKFI